MQNSIARFFRRLRPRTEGREPRYAAQRYARQRRIGFPFLRFFTDLEKEFRESFLAVNALRIRAAHTAGILAILGFIVLDEWFGASLQPMSAILVLLLVCNPALAAPIIVTYSARLRPYLQKFLVHCTLVMALGMVVVVYLGRLANVWFPYESVMLVMVYVYYVSGLLWWQATAIGWLLWLAMLLMGYAGFVEAAPEVLYEMYYLAALNFIGMIGRYVFEYQERLAFLLQRELRFLAQHDSLTGLLNRRAFRRQAEQVWAQAAREGCSVGVLLLDLNHFKKINDQHGHLIGDEVLQATATHLVKFARRPMDCAGRFGGDEFVAIWYDVEPQWFGEMQQQLHQELSAHTIEYKRYTVRVQISGGGVLVWPRSGVRFADVLHVADANLYEAKRKAGTIVWTQAAVDQYPAA